MELSFGVFLVHQKIKYPSIGELLIFGKTLTGVFIVTKKMTIRLKEVEKWSKVSLVYEV